MEIHKLEKYINDFCDDMRSSNTHRYKSWEHCFNFFKENHRNILENQDLLELASLQLSFYLASWGMYRGSTFLLQNDFKINIPIVKIICHQQYSCLFKELDEEKLFLLKKEIKEKYSENSNKASDTLITKILLGTNGSVVAYDEYVKKSLKELGFCKTFSSKGYKEILSLIEKHNDDFEKIKKNKGLESYPNMKLLDMYLFKKGYEIAKEG